MQGQHADASLLEALSLPGQCIARPSERHTHKGVTSLGSQLSLHLQKRQLSAEPLLPTAQLTPARHKALLVKLLRVQNDVAAAWVMVSRITVAA